MKQFRMASFILCTSFLASPAMAYLSLKGECCPQTNFCNWTGFYAGFNVGIVNNTLNITDTDATTFNATIQQVSDPKFIGGLQIGYRRQLDNRKTSGVYGAELNLIFTKAITHKEYGSDFALYQLDAKNTLNVLGLLQAVGGIATGKTFLFLAGGLGWANMTGSVTSLNTIPFFNSFSLQKNAFGPAFSAGIEYAFTDKISLRVKVDAIKPTTWSTDDELGDSFLISDCIVQGTIGMNYKFA